MAYCYYCVHKFRWKPRDFINMDAREKGLLIALIDQRIKEESKEMAKIKSRKRR